MISLVLKKWLKCHESDLNVPIGCLSFHTYLFFFSNFFLLFYVYMRYNIVTMNMNMNTCSFLKTMSEYIVNTMSKYIHTYIYKTHIYTYAITQVRSQTWVNTKRESKRESILNIRRRMSLASGTFSYIQDEVWDGFAFVCDGNLSVLLDWRHFNSIPLYCNLYVSNNFQLMIV